MPSKWVHFKTAGNCVIWCFRIDEKTVQTFKNLVICTITIFVEVVILLSGVPMWWDQKTLFISLFYQNPRIFGGTFQTWKATKL